MWWCEKTAARSGAAGRHARIPAWIHSTSSKAPVSSMTSPSPVSITLVVARPLKTNTPSANSSGSANRCMTGCTCVVSALPSHNLSAISANSPMRYLSLDLIAGPSIIADRFRRPIGARSFAFGIGQSSHTRLDGVGRWLKARHAAERQAIAHAAAEIPGGGACRLNGPADAILVKLNQEQYSLGARRINPGSRASRIEVNRR